MSREDTLFNENVVNSAPIWQLKRSHLLVTAAMAIMGNPLAYAEPGEALPEGKALPEVVKALPEVKVQSKKDTRSLPLDLPASTASRLGITLQETPASVEVLSKETMRERGDRTVTEAVEKAAGFTAAVTPGSPGMFSTRGFTNNAVAWLYNGTRIPGGSSMSARVLDIANFDRIEIIKGPAGVLHGEGSIGGAINLISRAPNFSNQPWELDYSYASFDTHRLHLGTGGAINDDVAAYRIDYSGTRFGTNVDHERGSLDRFTGSVLFKLSEKTKLTFELDKLYDDTDNVYFGTPLVNGKLKSSLRKINYNDISGNRYKSDSLWLRANLEWLPNEQWEIRNQFYYYTAYRDWRNTEAYTYNANNTVTRASWGDLDQDHDLIGNRFEALHKGQIAGLDNRFMLGTDINQTDFHNPRNGFPGGPLPATNAYNPADTSFAIGSGGVFKGNDTRDVTINQWSAFMDDQLSLTSKLKAVLGLRYDQFDTDWKYSTPATVTKRSNTYEFVSYRLGGVYDITPTLTTYASYGSAVEPGATLLLLNSTQSQLDLTTAKQAEIGLKHAFWEGKGEWTAAIYEITKKNVFVTDPNNSQNRLPIGQQSSRGIELGLGLRPSAQWQIDANIAATRARYDDYSTGIPPVNFSGNQPPFVPDYVANLGLRFMPTSDLSFSTWIRHVDSIYANDANTIRLPAYTTVDVAADYKVSKAVNLGFRVRNLTDEFYATFGSSNGRQAMIAAPRTFELSVNLRY
jgi:iron complex outermembrane recepter protein